jgi:hypothetical protein
MEWQRLEQLKEKIQTENDFGEIWKFFFDHLGENERFVRSGKQADSDIQDFVQPVVANICKHILGREVMIIEMLLTEAPGQHFYHGPCLTDAGLCVVLYFDDIKMGVFSFTQGLGSGLVHYARFTTLPVPRDNVAILRPSKETGH